jgi:methylmalonyl-CoA epimerase
MTEKFQAKSVDQIGIVVRDIDKAVESWSSLFGIGPWVFKDIDETDAGGHRIRVRRAFASLGPMQFELMQPVEGRLAISDFLDTHGKGVHHLCFVVDDVDEEAGKLAEQGVEVLETVPGRYAHLGTDGSCGVICEFLDRKRASSLLEAGE